MGSYGAAILIISLLATGIIVGAYVLAYASHCFLTVVEQTAAGGRAIDWPDEPFTDWIWKGFYLLWLTGLWLVPISLAVRPLDWPLLPKLALAGGLFCLVFPITLLSSLGGSSKLAVLSGAVLGRLARLWLRVLAFYVIGGLLLLGCGIVVGFGLKGWEAFRDAAKAGGPGWLGTLLEVWAWLVVLPVTALVVAATGLACGRLLGRLGFLLNQVRAAEEEEEEEEEADETPSPAEAKPAPVAAPPPALAQPAGDVFGLVEDAAPSPAVVYEMPRPRANRMQAAEVEGSPPGPLPPLVAAGTFALFGQRATWGVLAWLTLGGSVLAAILRIEIMIWPF